ncbi:MAG: EAL domain-containing protein [Spirochaetaceae bacterium]
MERNYYNFIIDNAKDFITLINDNYEYVFVNDRYCEAVDKNKDDLIGARVDDVWGKEKFELTIKGYLDRCFSGEEIHYIEEFKFGPFMKYMHVSYYPYHEEETVTHVAVFSHDITHIGRLESKLNHYEYRDPLTGLFNRRSLNAIFDKELERAQRLEGENLRILLFLELSGTEKVIEMYGQETFDLLLENTGLRIKEELRSSDYVFRFEGNQFSILLSQVKDRLDAGKVAIKIHEKVTFPYKFKGSDLSVGCHIGSAVYPHDGQSKEELIKKATSAMLESKRNNESFVLYDHSTHIKAVNRLELEGCAYKALEEKQFQLYFQPIVDRNYKIVGAEALIRWIHPEHGFISPGDFIPIIENTDLIYPIGKWVLYTACQRLSSWSKDHDLFLSINLSGREFSRSDIVKNVKNAINGCYNFSPHHLKLEITESTCVADIEKSVLHIRDLNRLGIEIFIDDFGTGNSSLQYLQNLPAGVLKIDQCFVNEIDKDEEQLEYLTHIVHMIKSRHKRVLVEGVERENQATLLVNMGCDLLQGFYFSRPLEEENFEKLLMMDAPLPPSDPTRANSGVR